MSADADHQIKLALDESRLLILGAQVLFGFQLEGVFQSMFGDLPADSRAVHCAGLALMLVSICLLIAPSLHHQIVHGGESRPQAIASATRFAGAALLPLTLGLGAAIFVVLEPLVGRGIGAGLGGAFTVAALALFYGLGWAMQRKELVMAPPPPHDATPLRVKIEQMLTEARVIIPGGQALLGFQLIATLTEAFRELPFPIQMLHAAGLCAVALAVMLLMTPAAVHRIAFNGADDEGFYRLGSGLVIAATAPLAIGIAADVAVVFYKITGSAGITAAAGGAAFALLAGVWFAWPAWLRARS
jgi:hypothetical protein